MLSVAEASERILAAFSPIGSEMVPLSEALGRVLAEPVIARVSQPPEAVSAMDGYAIRADDAPSLPVRLSVAMRLAAGTATTQRLEAGQAARIFTGAPLPEGADCIVIQENCAAEDHHVVIREGSVKPGQFVRPRGLDFKEGEIGIPAGRRLTARDIGLAAAMNWPTLPLLRKPRVAILATGNELVPPGGHIGPAQIVASNSFALAAFVEACGGQAIDLGIARDDAASLSKAIDDVASCELLVTTGGASVGEHDLVQSVLAKKGMVLDFWKIAMRPGKPLLFGRLGDLRVMGLPGNPVSVVVTATLFLRPALERMLGNSLAQTTTSPAVLGKDLDANDFRQDYLRARMEQRGGQWVVYPFDRQDSAMLSLLAKADCLVVRPPLAPAVKAGAIVDIVPLSGGYLSI